MKQMLLILNPISGMRKGQKYLSDIISVFNEADYDTHVYITRTQGDAARAVAQLGDGMELVVCCGGDGTLNETVTGMIENDLRIPIGYIPAGSTNDFAASLGLPTDPVAAAKGIVEGTTHTYDVGKFGDRYFTYIASFGAFTRTSYTTPQSVKNTLGHLAYVLEGISEISKIRKVPIRLELDGEALEGDYLFGAICNSTSVGGILSLHPDAVEMDDGRFEVLLIRTPKDLQELRACETALRTRQYDCGMITFRKAAKITAYADPTMAWTLDGERADGSECITIDNLHLRLQLVHP